MGQRFQIYRTISKQKITGCHRRNEKTKLHRIDNVQAERIVLQVIEYERIATVSFS